MLVHGICFQGYDLKDLELGIIYLLSRFANPRVGMCLNFKFVLRGGKTYCFENFFFYGNFSIAVDQKFRGEKSFRGWASDFGRGRKPAYTNEANV